MNKEYIEKHEAYLLLKYKAETYMLPATKEAYEKAAILIDSIKAHDVEPVRHGRWIYCEDDYGQDGIVCSLCGHFVPWYYDYYESSDDLIKDNLKCPHCGAKMNGGADDEQV